MQNDKEQAIQDLRLKILVDRHQSLDDEVDALNAQHTLLPSEQMKLKLLKILRLQAKETVDKFRRAQTIEGV